MVKLNWAVFCERAVIDSTTNSLTLMQILDEIHPSRPPPEILKEAAGRPIAAQFTCAIVTLWERPSIKDATSPAEVKIELFDPKNNLVIQAQQMLDFKSALRSRMLANLTALPVHLEGTYVWRISLSTSRRWKPSGEISYQLSYIDSQADVDKLTKLARENAVVLSTPIVSIPSAKTRGVKSARHR